MKNSFLVLGGGKVGRALCLSLKKKNERVYLWDRNTSKAKKFCNKHKILYIKNLGSFKGNFLIFAIKDDFIEKLANKVCKEIKEKGIAIHTSGIYTEEILNPLKKNGWIVGKCHPIYTFSGEEKGIPNGLTFGIQGEKEGIKKIKEFIKIFKGKALAIPKGKEDIYHFCLSIGCNFTGFLFYISNKIFTENFKGKNGLSPLFHKTVENILKYGKKGITGPHIRGDKRTIKKHKDLIKKKYPDLLSIYNSLSKGIIKIL